MDSENQREMYVEEMCDKARKEIKEISNLVLAIKENSFFRGEQTAVNQHGEMLANVMLAYRHLEDARMRVGKILQAKDGGQSVYDK